MADKCTWLGHDFDILEITANWSKECGGLYIFCRLSPQGWVPVYVGQCDCFCDRLTSHDRWDEAVRSGASHVHALSVPQAATRDSLEALLIRTYQPPLNEHFR